jgi:nucleotide-binding universal stress UspA family protein
MNNILVPIDFSEYSEAASAIAVKIASVTGAQIHYLHTNESKSNNQEIEEKLKAFTSKIKDVKTKTFIMDGVPFDDVINHSEEYDSGLIILSSSPVGAYHSSYTATNVLRITRLANCPVLIIPPNINKVSLKHIVFVNDFSFEIDYKEQVEKIFQSLVDLTQDFKPEFDLLYVNQDGANEEKLEKCMVDFAEGFSGQNLKTNIVKSESIEDGALAFAKKSGADVICLIGHGSGNYYTELRVSISERILEKADLPVILIRSSN